MNKERLQNVVRAISEGKEERKFDMSFWGYPCGTPACALGHYAFREDLQNEFTLKNGMVERSRKESGFYQETAEHFDITFGEALELFGSHGCNSSLFRPIGAKQAIAYIQDFIARHEVDKEVATAIEEIISAELQLT